MNKASNSALALLVLAGATAATIHPAQAQYVADENTSVTGGPIFVEQEDADQINIKGGQTLTINGATGLPLNPTAQMAGKGNYIVQAGYYQLWGNDVPGAKADSRLMSVNVATSLSSKLEVNVGVQKNSTSASGAASSAIEDAFDNSGISVGFKYLLNKPSTPDDVAIAIGAGINKALYNNKYAYVVASKALPIGTDRKIMGHLGLRYDSYKVDSSALTGDVSSNKVSAFAGVEVPLDKNGRFALVGEIGSKNANDELGGKEPYSVGLRFQNSSGLTATFGMMRQGVLSDIATDGTGLYVQVGKTF